MKYTLAALALSPVLLATSAAAPAQSTNDLSAVVAHMQAVSTMTASFTQTDRSGKAVSGKLLLKRPGHIRFEYQKGVPLLIVADGKALTLIDYEVKQVQRWPIKNSPLAALLDPGKDLARFGKRVATADPNVVSVEVRDPKRPEYGTITMVFVKQAGAPGGRAQSDGQRNPVGAHKDPPHTMLASRSVFARFCRGGVRMGGA